MTRKGSTKAADKGFGEGRLKVARAYLKAAQDEAALAEDGTIGNPIISQIVIAAIAYTDALTAKFAGNINQQDHGGATKVLRDALGNRLPSGQATRLRRILDEKDASQYGARLKTKADAERLLAQLVEFAKWAEAELSRPR
jgi:hypothetical protein